MRTQELLRTKCVQEHKNHYFSIMMHMLQTAYNQRFIYFFRNIFCTSYHFHKDMDR